MDGLIKHEHHIDDKCAKYLRSQGYTDIRDDQCCICYFSEEFALEHGTKLDKIEKDKHA